jgi:hypothetical protein
MARKSKIVFFPSSTSYKVRRAQQINVIEQFVVVFAINFVYGREKKRINYKHPGPVFSRFTSKRYFFGCALLSVVVVFDRLNQVLTS